jgi:hypothetical protein
MNFSILKLSAKNTAMKMTKPQLISASSLVVLKIKISVKKTVNTTVSNKKRTVINNDEISENR